MIVSVSYTHLFSEAAAAVNSDELKEALNSAADGVMDGEINEKDLSGALASMKSKSSGSNKSGSGNGSGSGDGSGNGEGNGLSLIHISFCTKR